MKRSHHGEEVASRPSRDSPSHSSSSVATASSSSTPMQLTGTSLLTPLPRRHPKKYKPSPLTSVQKAIAEIEIASHLGLEKVLSDCIFVGFADDSFILIQQSTKLYACNLLTLAQELMFQQTYLRFQNFDRLVLKPAIPIRDMLAAALESPAAREEARKERSQLPSLEYCVKFFMDGDSGTMKREMLHEYWSIIINDDGCLETLPQVIENYIPDMSRLPIFLYSLVINVDWQNEGECFEGVARRISEFYGPQPPILPPPQHVPDSGSSSTTSGTQSSSQDRHQTYEWTLQFRILPAVKQLLYPPKSFGQDGTFVQVASLENLYKVFERC